MFGRRKAQAAPIPEGFTAADIRIESSVCTGERTIGFYSREDRRLHYAELAETDSDIRSFFEKYGIDCEKYAKNK